MSQITGRVLNERYRLVREIGSGEITTVYEARDILLDRSVAVKILHSELTNKMLVEVFHRAAKDMVAMSHPYIVNTYASGKEENTHYLIQELAPPAIARMARLPVGSRETSRLGIQICEALKYAHKSGKLHGHIVPGNIHVDEAGAVKVSDFSMAHAMRSAARGTIPMSLQSALYASPEQLMGEDPGVASDIYSIGSLLYYLLSGATPYAAESSAELLNKQLHEKALSLRFRVEGSNSNLDAIILKALEIEPVDRHGQVESLLRALRDVYIRELTSREGQPIYSPVAHEAAYTPLAAQETEGKDMQEMISDAEKYRTPRRRRKGFPLYGKVMVLTALLAVLLALNGWLPVNIFPEEVTVPDVAGLTLADAESVLEESGLRMKVVSEQFSDKQEAGHVISTQPESERTVKKGRLIFAVVSKGIETVVVPNLYNLPYKGASQALTEMGLQVGAVEERYDENIEKGYIVSQSQESGTVIQKGAKISLVISMGPEEITGSEEGIQTTGVRKNATVLYTVPGEGERHRVRVAVRDDEGVVTSLDRFFSGGDVVRQEVTGVGVLRVSIYVDDRLVKEEEF